MVLLNVLLGAGAGLHQRHGSQRLASANQARNHGPNGCGMRRHATCNSKGSKHVQTCNSEGSIWKQNEANAMKQKLLEPGKNTLCDFSVPICRVPDLRKRSRCDSNPMFSREAASYSSKLMPNVVVSKVQVRLANGWALGAPRSVQLWLGHAALICQLWICLNLEAVADESHQGHPGLSMSFAFAAQVGVGCSWSWWTVRINNSPWPKSWKAAAITILLVRLPDQHVCCQKSPPPDIKWKTHSSIQQPRFSIQEFTGSGMLNVSI